MPSRNGCDLPQPKKVSSSFDPASTVRLPPPTVNQAYAWSGSSMKVSQLNLADHSNGLRTPESIVRLHEPESLKRGVIADDELSVKRPRISRYEDSLSRPETRGSLVSSEIGEKNYPLHWIPHFPGCSRETFDRDLERPNIAHPRTYSRSFNNLTTPSQFLHTGAMLSPSSTPLNRKEAPISTTPTRSEKNSMSVGDIANYSFVPFLNDARLTIMPPLPSSASAMTAAVSSAPSLSSQGIDSKLQFSENVISYGQSIPSPKKIEIPPPEEMPEVEDDGKKPIYSYAMLIGMAILRAPGRKLTLSQIYAWIMNTFEYYRTSKPTWHNSIRHNLSLNKAFEKKVRPKGDPGKGNYWVIVKDFEYQFLRPRSPKKGPDYSATPRTSSSLSDITPHVHVTSDPPQTSVSSAGPATLPVATIANLPAGQTHAGPQSSERPENLASDGTEPDDCLLEEEHGSEFGPIKPSDATFSSQTELSTGQSQCEPSSISNFDLPQMRAMSSSSVSRPHSPVKTFNMDALRPVKSAIGRSCAASLETSGNKARLRIPYFEEANEWRGEGQFAFRCSTPSLIRSRHEDCDTSGIPAALAERYVKPSAYFNFELQESCDPVRGAHAVFKENANDSLPRIRSAPTPSNQERDLYRPDVTWRAPRTPEKTPNQTQGFAPNQFHKAGSSVWPNASLAPPKSFESPFAGTLDLSPGSSFLYDIPGTERSQQQSQSLQLHRTKKLSPNHLADFLELDFRKPDNHSGHNRTPSASSDDTSNAQFNQAPSSSLPGNTTGSIGSAGSTGSGSYWNSFSMSLDVEISPRAVMTPIRRPFDTPIRDQSHTYSPYCHDASSSFGSPLRRAS